MDPQPASQPSDCQPVRDAADQRVQDAAAPFNLDEAVRKCFGRYDLFCDMVSCLFDETDPLLARMRQGLTKGDPEEVAEAAHRLKGTLVYLSVPSALDATRRVEQIGLSGDLSTVTEAIDELQRQLTVVRITLAPHRRQVRK